MSDTNELRAVKLTKAQERPILNRIQGLPYLVNDDLGITTTAPSIARRVRLDVLPRRVLSTSDARAPSVEEGKHG